MPKRCDKPATAAMIKGGYRFCDEHPPTDTTGSEPAEGPCDYPRDGLGAARHPREEAAADEGPTVYRIPAQNLAQLRGRVEWLNKRAAKLGVPALTLSEGEPYTVERRLPTIPGGEVRTVSERYTDCTLTGEPIGLPGWTFKGTVEHTPAGNLLRAAPDQEIPKTYRDASPLCEHCGTDRQRAHTFIVAHEDGTTKQIGRQCTRDYLGHTDPDKLVGWLQYVTDLEGDEPGLWDGVRYAPRYTPREIVTHAAAWVRLAGFRPSAHNDSTAGLVGITLGNNRTSYEQERIDRLGWDWLTDEDRAEADRLLAWIADNPEDSGYINNLRVAAALEYADPRKHLGLLASLPKAAQNAEQRAREQAERDARKAEREAEAAARPPVPLGAVEVHGEIVNLSTRENDFGVRTVCTVRDRAGWAVWGTLPSALSGARVGSLVRFTCTVDAASDDDPSFGFYKRPRKAIEDAGTDANEDGASA